MPSCKKAKNKNKKIWSFVRLIKKVSCRNLTAAGALLIHFFCLFLFVFNLHDLDCLWEEVEAVVWKAVRIFDGPNENGGSGFQGQWTTTDTSTGLKSPSFKRMKRTLHSLVTQEVGWKLGPSGNVFSDTSGSITLKTQLQTASEELPAKLRLLEKKKQWFTSVFAVFVKT